jgi:4-amino-4-deoxy-L-arabinose transferase-like glycosyltransferase
MRQRSEMLSPSPGATVNLTPANRRWAIPGLLVLASILPTLALWNRATYLSGDSYQYLRAALTFSRGQGLQDMSGEPFIFLGPLYSLFVGVTYRVIPIINIETLARLFSLLGATVAVVAFYWLVQRRHSQTVAILSALLFALVPLRIWSGQWVLTNGLALGLTLSGVTLLFRRERPVEWTAVVSGILLGLAYLTRSDALVFCLGGFIYLVLFSDLPRLNSRLVVSGLFLLGLVLVASPYHLWIHAHTGAWSNNAALYNLDVSEALYRGTSAPLAGWHFDSTSATFVRQFPDLGWSAVIGRYLHFAQLEITRLTYLIGPRLIVLPLLLVGGIRFLIALCKQRIDALWQALLLSLLLVLPLFHTEDRYLLPVVPVLCLWMVDGAMSVGNWISQHRRLRLTVVKPVWISSVLIALILGSYAYRLSAQLPPANSRNLPRDVAVWMRDNHLADGRIMAQEPALAFYRGADHVWLPDGPTAEVIRYARQQDVRYIFVSSGDLIPLSHKLLPGQDVPATGLLSRGMFDLQGVSARLFELNPEANSRK